MTQFCNKHVVTLTNGGKIIAKINIRRVTKYRVVTFVFTNSNGVRTKVHGKISK